jgi:hypothetical protein
MGGSWEPPDSTLGIVDTHDERSALRDSQKSVQLSSTTDI